MPEPGNVEDFDSILDIQVPAQHRERKVTMGTSISVTIANYIDQVAGRRRLTPSAVLRLAVLDYLEREGFDVKAYRS